jgi:glycosyltransferase involved in cell wall biosynthesis
VETFLMTLARWDATNSARSQVFGICFEGAFRQELSGLGAPIHNLGPVRFRHPWTVWFGRRRLAALLKRERFDAVLCHECWPHAVFAPAARRCRIPVIFCGHDTHLDTHWLDRLASRIRPDLALANSRYNKEALRKLFPDVPTEVNYYPVSPCPVLDREDTRQKARQELGTPQAAVVLLMATRMERWKGHPVFLEALAGLKDVPGWECWIAGGAQRPQEVAYLDEVKRRAVDAGLGERVRFLGQRRDLLALMVAADVYVQPNVGPETFGRSLVEALAAGLPVVTSALGGPLELVDETCGFLLPPGDSVALRETLGELLRRPQLRERLGRAGPERTRRLSDSAAYLERVRTSLASLSAEATLGVEVN